MDVISVVLPVKLQRLPICPWQYFRISKRPGSGRFKSLEKRLNCIFHGFVRNNWHSIGEVVSHLHHKLDVCASYLAEGHDSSLSVKLFNMHYATKDVELDMLRDEGLISTECHKYNSVRTANAVTYNQADRQDEQVDCQNAVKDPTRFPKPTGVMIYRHQSNISHIEKSLKTCLRRLGVCERDLSIRFRRHSTKQSSKWRTDNQFPELSTAQGLR